MAGMGGKRGERMRREEGEREGGEKGEGWERKGIITLCSFPTQELCVYGIDGLVLVWFTGRLY